MTTERTSLMAFPCEYHFKVIGKNHIEFEGFVVSTIRQHFPKLSESAVKIRESSSSQFISLTVTVMAESQEAIDNAYRALTASERVLVAL